MKSQLEGVKKTLADTRRATQIEFLCFRKEKDKSSRAAVAPTIGTSTSTGTVAGGEEGRERRRRPGTAPGPSPSNAQSQIKSTNTRI